tara:strand:+ start:4407 stop:5153 length:747 start_codon:yes stop_codon:yes gene_type:complete
MKIAIIVPTRERMNNRLTLLFSILTTIDNIDNVNIYYGVDKDDPTLDTIKKVASAIPSLKIVEIDNEGKFLGLGVLWNKIVKVSNEEIISMIGDDMVFKTPGWDTMLLEEFKNMPKDQIQAIHCNDDCHGAKLAVNLFCHRKYVEILGHFMREEFKINWVDQWLHQMFSAFGRLKYRGDIMIEHRHWVLGKTPRDNTAIRMNDANGGQEVISDKLWHDLVDERISDVKKLGEYLKMDPDWKKVDTGKN